MAGSFLTRWLIMRRLRNCRIGGLGITDALHSHVETTPGRGGGQRLLRVRRSHRASSGNRSSPGSGGISFPPHGLAPSIPKARPGRAEKAVPVVVDWIGGIVHLLLPRVMSQPADPVPSDAAPGRYRLVVVSTWKSEYTCRSAAGVLVSGYMALRIWRPKGRWFSVPVRIHHGSTCPFSGT